jgi:hypothetical protein
MNYFAVLQKYYSEDEWCIDDTYESLVYHTGTKPTKEHLQSLWVNIEMDLVREERNQRLADSDFKVVSDYPNRDKWLVYRQELRDLPNNWTGTYPEEPTE